MEGAGGRGGWQLVCDPLQSPVSAGSCADVSTLTWKLLHGKVCTRLPPPDTRCTRDDTWLSDNDVIPNSSPCHILPAAFVSWIFVARVVYEASPT